MKHLALAIAIVGASSVARAQPARMDVGQLRELAGTEPPEVILLTFGIGERIFEKFGHAAVCLHYRASGRSPVCFNYGVTDFAATGDLAWGFLRGQQKFWVEPERWSSMIGFYEHEDRDIWEQKLPLAPDQARAFEAKLLSDIDEANRYYIYDHFYDNCTTRLRDMLDTVTGGKLRPGSDTSYPLTFRDMGRRGLAEFPPVVALTDFVVGRTLDVHPTLWDAMFYPGVLREHVAATLGVVPTLVYQRHGPPFPTDGSSGRLPMLGLALVFALPLLVATWRRRFQRVALAWATLYLVFWGLLIWGLVAISAIPGIRWNEAVLVFVPFDVVLPFLGAERRRAYARVRVVLLLLASALCAIGVLRQPLWIPILSAIMPLAIVAFGDRSARALNEA